MALKIEIQTTPELVEFDGVKCRLWVGKTPKGVPCYLLVHRVMFREEDDDSEIAGVLLLVAKPKRVALEVPSRIGLDTVSQPSAGPLKGGI